MAESKRGRAKRHIAPIFKSVSPGTAGSVPGTPVYIGERAPTEAAFSLIQYSEDEVSFVTPDHVEGVLASLEEGMVNWINVNGLADQDAIKRIAGYLRVDSLTVEDILNTEHRPKVEDFGRYLFVITKMLTLRPDGSIEYEQVSIVLTGNAVVTFQETPGDCFGPVRERLRTGAGRLRREGAGFLAYAIMDVIIDNYFAVLEGLGDRLDEFEEMSLAAREASIFMSALQAVRADLNRLRRVVWPVRETVSALLHSDSALMDESIDPFLRDLHENTIQIQEALDSYRETASGIQEVFLSSVSNRMNEIMKVLTIISTIFIPLTFIAGVYGMNFKHMPELERAWAYPLTLGVMAVIAIGLLAFFKRKKWI